MAANTQTNNLLVNNEGVNEKINSETLLEINALSLTQATGNGLSVTADAAIGGNAAVTGNQTITGTLGVTGATLLTTVSSSGAATLNSAAITNGATVGTTLAVTGAATLSSTLAVTGTTTMSDDLTLSGVGSDLSVGGTAAVTGTATIGGNLTAQSNLAVSGTSALADKLTISANGADITGNVAITGNETVSGTLGVTGGTSLSTLTTSGAATLNSASVSTTLGVTGNSTLSGTLAVTGTSTFSDDVTIVNGKDLNVGSDLTVGGTAAVTGALSTNSTFTANSTGTFGGALTVSSGGAAITGNSSVTGTLSATSNLSAGGTLAVTGAATLSDNLTVVGNIDVGNGDFQVTAATGAVGMTGALTVGGTSNLDGGIAVDTSNFTVSGTTGAVHTAGDFDVATNKFTVAAASGNTAVAGTLAVTGAATFSDALSANSGAFTTTLSAADVSASSSLDVGASSFTVNADGDVDADGTLAVGGAATLSSTLAVTGAATFSSSASVTGNLDVNSNFAVDAATGNVSTDGSLSVATTSSLTGNVTAGANLSVAGTSTLTGAVTASSTLTAAGLITGNGGAAFNGDVDIVGDLTVEGDIVAKNKVNLTVEDYFIDLGLGNTGTSAQSGGLTIEMARNAGFVNMWTNLTFAAGVGPAVSAPTITAVTSGSALANGDIICVTGADENNGYYVVNSVAGSVITLKGVGGAPVNSSVPFAQNQVQAGAFAAANAFKCDIAVMAVANGSASFKDPNGNAWPLGTFITATVQNATEGNFAGNNAWTSVGQVDLQEAYNTGNTIALSAGKNLIVSKGAGVASIQYQAAGSSFYQVAADNGQSLNFAVVPAAGGAAQAQLQFDDVRSAGNYDAMLVAEGQVTVQADGGAFLAQAKTGSATVKAVDAGNALKSQVVANIDGSLQVQATSGVMQVTAKDFAAIDANANIELWSKTVRKNDLTNGLFAADSTALPFAAAIADKVLVAITSTGFAAADASNPNIVGVTLTSSAGANAAAYVANSFGNLVNITKTGNVSVGQVVYLAANGTISATAPSAAGQTIMRVGYVVSRAGQAAPTVYFAPQFIAKVL